MPVIKEVFTRICFMLTVQITFYIMWSLLKKLAVYDIKKLFILLHIYWQPFSEREREREEKKKAHRLLPAGKQICASSSLFHSFLTVFLCSCDFILYSSIKYAVEICMC